MKMSRGLYVNCFVFECFCSRISLAVFYHFVGTIKYDNLSGDYFFLVESVVRKLSRRVNYCFCIVSRVACLFMLLQSSLVLI